MSYSRSKLLNVSIIATSLLVATLNVSHAKNICYSQHWKGCGQYSDRRESGGVMWSDRSCNEIGARKVYNDSYNDIVNKPECEFEGPQKLLCYSEPWINALPECGAINSQGIRWTIAHQCPADSTPLTGEAYTKWEYVFEKPECKL